jgi:hypothetical protein
MDVKKYSSIRICLLIIKMSKVVHRLKAQLNEFLEPQAQALGSGVFEPRLSRFRLRLNGFEPRLRLRLRLSLSSLKSL